MEVKTFIEQSDAATIAHEIEMGRDLELRCPSGNFIADLGDVAVEYKAHDGYVGTAFRSTQVALDTRITPELAREGMARDVIRQVQDLRKNAGLEMEDRIALCLATESTELQKAIDAHRDYIAAETLTKEWVAAPFDPHSAKVKIDGQALTISLRKV